MPELLAAEPAAAPGMEQRHRVLGQVREVPPDQARVGDDVGAHRLLLEALRGRGPILARPASRASAPLPRRAPPPRAAARRKSGTRAGSRGGEEIAAPVHAEDVAALPGQLLEEVDAAVHQGHHVVARTRPPVAVGLGGLVAGEGQRRALVHEDDAADSPADGQVVGGGDARDPRPADDDLGGAARSCGHDPTAPRAFPRAEVYARPEEGRPCDGVTCGAAAMSRTGRARAPLAGSAAGMKIGGAGLIAVVVVSLLLGLNPLDVLVGLQGGAPPSAHEPGPAVAPGRGRRGARRDQGVRRPRARRHRGHLARALRAAWAASISRRASCSSAAPSSPPAASPARPSAPSTARRTSRVYLDRSFFEDLASRVRGARRVRPRLRDRARDRPPRAEPHGRHREGRGGAAGAPAARGAIAVGGAGAPGGLPGRGVGTLRAAAQAARSRRRGGRAPGRRRHRRRPHPAPVPRPGVARVLHPRLVRAARALVPRRPRRRRGAPVRHLLRAAAARAPDRQRAPSDSSSSFNSGAASSSSGPTASSASTCSASQA